MNVTLPDGTQLDLPDGATGADAAAAIGPGLARAALAVKVDGEVRDLARPLDDGAALEIVTAKSGQDALDVIRHDAAHVLATAVMELYPGVKISIGPPIENGFYYDFDFPEGVTVTEADFPAIEEKMREHIAAGEAFDRSEITVAEALERFRDEAQDYKVELIEDLVEAQGIETVSLYRNGPFTDLCRGPHAPSTASVGAIKLPVRRRRLLARRREPADAHAHLRHRLLLQEGARPRTWSASSRRGRATTASSARSSGCSSSPTSRPGRRSGCPRARRSGTSSSRCHARSGLERGYTEVKTPQLYESELWKTSGHWGKYRENMFVDGDRGPASSG